MANQVERALVPQGLEYGARRQVVGDRRQAGMPQGVGLAAPGVPSDMLASVVPSRQPNIQELLAPAAAAEPAPKDRLRLMRDTTPNAILREMLNRVLGE